MNYSMNLCPIKRSTCTRYRTATPGTCTRVHDIYLCIYLYLSTLPPSSLLTARHTFVVVDVLVLHLHSWLAAAAVDPYPYHLVALHFRAGKEFFAFFFSRRVLVPTTTAHRVFSLLFFALLSMEMSLSLPVAVLFSFDDVFHFHYWYLWPH